MVVRDIEFTFDGKHMFVAIGFEIRKYNVTEKSAAALSE